MNYIDNTKKEILDWENEKPGFLAKISKKILSPAQEIVGNLVPNEVLEKVTVAVEKVLSGIAGLSPNTINLDEINNRVGTNHDHFEAKLKAMDLAAKHYWNYHISYGIGEGAATGAAGLPGLALDIPALFGLAIRLIQEISTCYGYDINSKNEQVYIMNVLSTGATSDIDVKASLLVGLKEIEQILLKVAWKKIYESYAQNEFSKKTAIATFREFCKSIGIQLTKRKALQMIVLIGAAVGATFNATFINDVGKAAYMSYRRRKIAEFEGNLIESN